MAILAVNEIPEGRRGGIKETGERTYTRVFRAITDDPLVEPSIILEHPAIPAMFQGYEVQTRDRLVVDQFAKVKSRDPQQHGDEPQIWLVTVEYSSFVDWDDFNPLLRRPKRRWSTQNSSRPAAEHFDAEDNARPIANSAHDPFDPPPEIEDGTLGLTYTRNEALFDDQAAEELLHAVNEDECFGRPPGRVKIRSIDAEEQEENEFNFFAVTYVFEFGDHRLSLLDAGYREYLTSPGEEPEPDQGEWRPITDRQGRPVTQPALLDGHGRQLTDLDNPVFLRFRVRKRTFNAAALGFT